MLKKFLQRVFQRNIPQRNVQTAAPQSGTMFYNPHLGSYSTEQDFTTAVTKILAISRDSMLTDKVNFNERFYRALKKDLKKTINAKTPNYTSITPYANISKHRRETPVGTEVYYKVVLHTTTHEVNDIFEALALVAEELGWDDDRQKKA